MGKGDRRTKRGKINQGSYGVTRLKKAKKRKKKQAAKAGA
jgi:ribosomal small subunit protein bTHX